MFQPRTQVLREAIFRSHLSGIGLGELLRLFQQAWDLVLTLTLMQKGWCLHLGPLPKCSGTSVCNLA